jgi:tetratricopeptide (TPR) repeat protein
MKKLLCFSTALFLGASALLAQRPADDPNIPVQLKPAMKSYNAALELEAAGEAEAALVAYREALQQAESAKHASAKVVLSSAANNAGTLLLAKGKLDEAEAMFRKAMQADPQHALALNNLAGVLLRQKKVDEAIATYEQANKADPRQGMALNNLARLLLLAKDYSGAAKALHASLQVAPVNMRETLLLTSVVYEKMQQPREEQERIWRVLVATTDKKPASQLQLIKELLKAGARQQPTQLLANLLQKSPEWPEARLLQARVQMLSNQNEQALKTIQELLPAMTQDFSVRQDAIALLTQGGKLEEAGSIAQQAVKDFPKLGAAWYALGCIEEKRENLKAAEKAYFEATKLDASLADGWNNLGNVVSKRNDAKTAIFCYGKALEADKSHAKAKYNLARTLVISKADIKKGLQLMAVVASGSSEVAPEAKKFIDEAAAMAKAGPSVNVTAK